jgi:hypothetical protein
MSGTAGQHRTWSCAVDQAARLAARGAPMEALWPSQTVTIISAWTSKI